MDWAKKDERSTVHFLDAEKSFDRIEWSFFLLQVLKKN